MNNAAPLSAASMVDDVRAALEGADVARFGALLSPDVHWGAPDDPTPPCRNRQQALRWYRKGRAAGRRAKVIEISVHGDALLVGLLVDLSGVEGEVERWQILTVGPQGIEDIRGFSDRPDALARLDY